MFAFHHPKVQFSNPVLEIVTGKKVYKM